jgi:hypothetical protein
MGSDLCTVDILVEVGCAIRLELGVNVGADRAFDVVTESLTG